MHLVNLTTARLKRLTILTFSLLIYNLSFSQENSPYSRYGVGDVVPGQNMANRSMGGIAAGYSDYYNLNFVNPASLGMVLKATLDIGAEIDRRTLKSNLSPDKYTSTNTIISYLQFAVPLGSRKMELKKRSWGLSFGLKPLTRINYKIQDNGRADGIDSLQTTYEGTGGINQVFLSTGVKLNRFSFGITGGYSFGSKDYSTRLNFVNDSVIYYKSNTETKSTFGGAFITGGLLYDVKKTKEEIITIGAYGTLQQKFKAKQSTINETTSFDGNGGFLTIDTVDYRPEVKGDIVYPSTYGFGFTRLTKNLLYGADFEITNWDNYRYYEAEDFLQNSWKIKAGVQYRPFKEGGSRRYLNLVQYRGGAYFGPDLVKLDQNKRNEFGITLGAGLPLTTQRSDFAMLNAGIEFNSRGNKESRSLRENVMRFTLGFSMNATWFQKRKYD